MERHNRKSYLAPPAPKSLKDNATPTSGSSSGVTSTPTSAAMATPKPNPISKSSSSRQQPSYHQTPTSNDLPLNMANDDRYYGAQQQSHHYSSSRSTRSPPPPSLEHLSLETKMEEDRAGRRPVRHLGDPESAIDAPTRPFMSPRSISSNNKPQANLTSTLPMRPAPPSGPPPPAPVSAGGNWRGYPGQMPGAS